MPSALLKRDSYCVYCEILKNNCFEEDLRTSASVPNFLVDALRAGIIRPSLENTLSMANLPVHLFSTFFEPFTLTFFLFGIFYLAPMK